jgi:putative ABC transport system permease protein
VGGFTSDALVYLDYAALQERAGFGDVVNAIAIDASQPDLVRKRLADLGRLTLSTPAELVRQAEQATAADLIGHWIISLLSLSIGALFVSTMLGRSVVERRLEFATLKAIGLPTRVILLVVALEAVVICLVAAVLGVGLGLATGWLLNAALAPSYGIESIYAVDVFSFLIVFLLALGLGLVAGLLPARRATRVDPVEILREA